MNNIQKPKAIIFDIDGVLAKKSPERDYRDYDKVDSDSPIGHTFELLKYYIQQRDIKIIFITGRKEYCYEKTFSWISKNIGGNYYFSKFLSYLLNNDFNICYGILFDKSIVCKGIFYMREDKDHRPAHILKKEIYENHIKDKYNVVAVFEDDIENCKMFKEQGLFVLQPWTRD